MALPSQGEISIGSEMDIVTARKTVREVATALGFGLTDVTRVVTAASELARNIYTFAGQGVMCWCVLNRPAGVGLELTFEDHGPGIPDVELALQPGYTTAKGMGMGLPGSQRLMDELEICSEVGRGTTVVVRKWRKK